MNDNWPTFLVDENIQINYYSFQMIGQETTKLLDYLPTNPYDWQWHTCSEGQSTPAQKPNRSIPCNSLSTRLPVRFSDPQSCPFIKYNCAPHTCPFRLLSPKPQTYPSVNVWKIYNKLAACLYTQVIVTKKPFIHTSIFLLFFTAHCKHVGTVMPLPTHK